MTKALGNYKIIYREWDSKCGEEEARYICRGRDGGVFRLLEITRAACVTDMIPYMSVIKLRDYIEGFSLNGKYYLVFRQHVGKPIASQHWEQSERNLIARGIVESLVSANLPPELAIGVLDTDKLLTDSGFRISFAYMPPLLSVEVTGRQVCERLAELIAGLWPARVDTDAAGWLEILRTGGFKNMAEAFLRMPEPIEQPPEPPVNLKNAVMELIKRVTPILAALLALAAAAWLFLSQPAPEPENGSIQRLGDIVIEE